MMRSLAVHRAMRRLRNGGQADRIPTPDFDLHSGSNGPTLVGMIAEVESFCVSRTTERIKSELGKDSALARDATREVERGIEGSWQQRIHSWKRWYGVVAARSDFDKTLAFVEARNAIVHGSGHLTRRQLGNDAGRSVINQLRANGVKVQNGRIILTDDNLSACAVASRESIFWFDHEIETAAALA